MIYCLKNLAMQNIRVPNWGKDPGNMQNLAFTWIEFHFRIFFPSSYFLEVLLEGLAVGFAVYGQIYSSSLSSEWIFSWRSLIYKRNKIGPKTEPWGNPDVTGILDDFSPSKATHCVRLSTKALSQLGLFRVIPCWCSLFSHFVWLTLSKALLKSRRTTCLMTWGIPVKSLGRGISNYCLAAVTARSLSIWKVFYLISCIIFKQC